MKPYEKYKESNIPWVDQLPVTWNESRLRYLGILNAGGVDKKINEGENLYKSVHYMDVYRGSLRNIFDSDNYLVVSATPEKRDKCILRKGDVLFTTSSETPDDIGHSCVIGENLKDTLFGYHLLRLRVTDKIDFQFRKYLFGANYLRTWFSYRAVGMTRYGISNMDFADARIMIPPIEDQQKISKYLDRKVSQIDDTIQNKQELIDLLKEQRVSVICSAVTRGIRSSVEMKDSAIEWLGQTPAHWQILTNHQLFAERNIKCTEPDAVLLSVTKHLGVILQSQAEELNLSTVAPAETTEGYKVVHKGDLVMNIMRAKDGSYGVSEYDGVISPAYCIYYPRQEINPQYLYYLFKTPTYMEIFKNYSTGIAEHRMRLYPVNFFKIPAVVPPLEEQNEIVVYLNKRVKDIDELISLTQQQIEKLKEYRQSVISEVVTGKVAVE